MVRGKDSKNYGGCKDRTCTELKTKTCKSLWGEVEDIRNPASASKDATSAGFEYTFPDLEPDHVLALGPRAMGHGTRVQGT